MAKKKTANTKHKTSFVILNITNSTYAVHRCLRYRAACQSPKFPAANISVRPAVANQIFRGFVAVLLALGLSQSSVRQFETYCQIHCMIQLLSLNILGGTSKHIVLLDIRDMSALEVSSFHIIALYNSTFTYLLTYAVRT